MEWVTRARPKTDRIASPWLIMRFIDPEATVTYVQPDQVLAYAAEHGARSFDAPGAEFTHRDGRCTFEVLLEEFDLAEGFTSVEPDDNTLLAMELPVYDALYAWCRRT